MASNDEYQQQQFFDKKESWMDGEIKRVQAQIKLTEEKMLDDFWERYNNQIKNHNQNDNNRDNKKDI